VLVLVLIRFRAGKVFLSVEQLHSDKLMGEWYRLQKEHRPGAFATLTGLGTQGSDSICSLRIGTALEERVILPICSYKPMLGVRNILRYLNVVL
jgi:hypothetical protein